MHLKKIAWILIFSIVIYTQQYLIEPSGSLAASTLTAATDRHAKPEEKITPFSIVLFYAGMVGIVIGMATGWMILLLSPFENIKTKSPMNN